ncbi:MAG TPA: family 16 glycosylhydrolase [Verrucomicrobiae bacterium]|nr:family 16 glycosylhydrolase [Verrucomicrobiae bacterium]
MAAPPAGYYEVWGDEFNGTSLDTTKWDYWVPGSWGNAVNVSNAVSVNGSNLVITTYSANNTNYTSIIASDNHFRPRYGYYEASIKWGDTNGEWSAFWLRSPTMGTWLNDAFVSGAEIDCCEHRYVGIYHTNYIANIVSDNIHWNGYGSQEQNAGSPNVGSNLQNGFHTYGLLWNGPTYSFSIDGSQVWDGTPAPLFGSDVYIILSSQVDDTSTTWAGYIPAGGYGSQSSSVIKYTVDYFRYYAPTNVLFWSGASSAYWTNSANWVSNMVPAANSDLTFSYLTKTASTTLGSNYTVDGLIFLNMTNTPSINGSSTLTIGAGGIDMVAANQNVTFTAPIILSANQRWTVGINNPGNLLNVNTSIGGSATLTKAGYGALLLNGANSFSGVLNVDTGSSITNDGILVVNGTRAISNVVSPISIRNGGMGVSTLQLSNSVYVSQAITAAGRNTNVAVIDAVSGTSNTLAGGVTLTGGGPNYIIECDSGALDLTGPISASTASPCNLTLQGNGNFTLSGALQNGSASLLSLTKTNNGSLTISSVNNFNGGMTNWGGGLFLNGSITGPLVVNGGTLAGVGSVGGSVNIAGGEISPGTAIGNSIGTLTFGGDLILGSKTLTLICVNAATQTNGVLNAGGSVTYGGRLYIVNQGGTLDGGQNFKLFNGSTYSGLFDTLTLPSLNPGLQWSTNGLTNGILSIIGPPQTLVFTNLGGGQMQLSWEYGNLQTATNVNGPYTNVVGATSPYTVVTSNSQQYFRVSQ